MIGAPRSKRCAVRTVRHDDHSLTECQPVFDKPDELSDDREFVRVHINGVVMRRSVGHHIDGKSIVHIHCHTANGPLVAPIAERLSTYTSADVSVSDWTQVATWLLGDLHNDADRAASDVD